MSGWATPSHTMIAQARLSRLLFFTSALAPAVLAGTFQLPLQQPDSTENAKRSTKKVVGDAAVSKIYNGTGWVVPVTLGGQQVNLQFDTGSSDLWIASTLLPESFVEANASQNRLYNPEQSSSWKEVNGYEFSIAYDVGELGAEGVVGTEDVEVGGLTASGFPIGAATHLFGRGIIDETYDGIFGLGFQGVNTMKAADGKHQPGPTFMDWVGPQLDDKVFTCSFQAERSASLAFGFVDSSLYSGDLSTLRIDDSKGLWNVDGVRIAAGDRQLGGGADNPGINMLLDTGGLGTVADAASVRDYWSLVPGSAWGQSGYTYPCDTESMPDLTLLFKNGSARAMIPGSLLDNAAFNLYNGTCIGGLQPAKSKMGTVGFGFFAQYFTIWNPEERTVSFASYSGVEDTSAIPSSNPSSSEATIGPSAASTSYPGGPTVSSSSGPLHSTEFDQPPSSGSVTVSTGSLSVPSGAASSPTGTVSGPPTSSLSSTSVAVAAPQVQWVGYGWGTGLCLAIGGLLIGL